MGKHYNSKEGELFSKALFEDSTEKNLAITTDSLSNNIPNNELKTAMENFNVNDTPSLCEHIHTDELHILYSHINILNKNVIHNMNFSKCNICCNFCAQQPLNDLYLCLDCVYMGNLGDNHWNQHMHTTGHNLCINVKSSKVVCIQCVNESLSNIEGDNCADIINSGRCCSEDCRQIEKDINDEILGEFFENYNLNSFTSIGSFNSAVPIEGEPVMEGPNFNNPCGMMDKPPMGMINIGNSCFMNCILQIFLATPPLIHFFLSGYHNCNGLNKKCITCELILIFHCILTNQSDNKLNIETFIRSLSSDEGETLTISQQDAHEYFTLIVGKIHNELMNEKFLINLDNNDCLYSSLINQSKNSFLSDRTSNFPSSNPTSDMESFDFINHIFQGSYSLKVCCTSCKNITSKFEPFIDISLGLQVKDKKENSINLYDCIETFVKEENMGNGCTLYCQNCDSQQQKVTKFTLNKLPNILCLHIKRFTLGNGVEKLDVKIDFPHHLDLLNFTDATSEHFYNDENDIKACEDIAKNGGTQYTLYGVVVHRGLYQAGHYVSYVRINQQWYLCDDENIQPVSYETVSQCECYILFYKKDRIPEVGLQ